jgi:hypothetical protein
VGAAHQARAFQGFQWPRFLAWFIAKSQLLTSPDEEPTGEAGMTALDRDFSPERNGSSRKTGGETHVRPVKARRAKSTSAGMLALTPPSGDRHSRNALQTSLKCRAIEIKASAYSPKLR